MCLLTLTRIAHDDSVDGGAAQAPRGYVRPARSLQQRPELLPLGNRRLIVRSPCRYCPFLSELHALKIDLFLRQQGISVDQSDTSMYSTPYTCNFSDPRLNSGGDFRSLGGPAVPCFGFQLQRPKFRVSVSVPDPIAGAGLPGPIFANGRRLTATAEENRRNLRRTSEF
jgi:hypothetical protein